MIEISKEVMQIENEILELVDGQEEYSRSDLQGRAMAIAHKAIKTGIELQKRKISIDEWLEIGKDNNYN